MNKKLASHPSSRLYLLISPMRFFYILFLILGSGSCLAAHRHVVKHTYLYALLSTPNSRGQNIVCFRQEHNGELVRVHLNIKNDFADLTGSFLSSTPDNHYLFAQCEEIASTTTSPPSFVKYYILPTGQLREIKWISLTNTVNATRLSFNSNGRIAYLLQPGSILEFHVRPDGNIITTPFSSVPTSQQPFNMIITRNGQFAYVYDPNALWQYSITQTGLLKPLNPPSLSMKDLYAESIAESNNHFLYVFRVTPGIDYRAPSSQKVINLFKIVKSGILIPNNPSTLTIHVNDNLLTMAVDGGKPYLYVGTGEKLIVMKINHNGTLSYLTSLTWNKPGLYDFVIDAVHGYLYQAGSYNAIHIFRILANGRLVPVPGHYPHVGTTVQDMIIVRR